MRVHEILRENMMDYDQAVDIVRSYTTQYEVGAPHQLDKAVDTLIENPKNQFNGQMFRGIVFDATKIENIRDPQSYVGVLRKDKAQTRYESWSITQRGVIQAIGSNADAGFYDHMELGVIIVLVQTGTALNIEAVLGEDILDETEEELLAESQNPQVFGFAFGFTVYPINQFEKFLAELEPELEDFQ